jgi:hypothetical protein
MGATMGPPSFRERNIGIVILVALQIIVGIIHLVFGFWFVVASPDIYGIYTTVFSVLTLLFAAGLWLNRRWGWVGTVSVALFVIIADTLTLLNLPSVPGIPKFAGFGEISYSIVLIVYLIQSKISRNFKICQN